MKRAQQFLVLAATVGASLASWPATVRAQDSLDSGDTAWILTSTALVLFMTIPTTTFTAPNGSWKTFVILRSATGTVDFDDVVMSNQPLFQHPSVEGFFSDPATFRIWWQSLPEVDYRIESSGDLQFWEALKTVTGDGGVMTEDANAAGTSQSYFRLQIVE